MARGASFVDFGGFYFAPGVVMIASSSASETPSRSVESRGDCDGVGIVYSPENQPKDKNIKAPCGMRFDAANEWRL